jgi:hypothetical protein
MISRDVHCLQCRDTGRVHDCDDLDQDGPRYTACERCQYRVWAANRLVWWGEASGIVDALDRARAACPELRDHDLAATSPISMERAS